MSKKIKKEQPCLDNLFYCKKEMHLKWKKLRVGINLLRNRLENQTGRK